MKSDFHLIKSTKSLVLTALMTAITILLAYTPLGMIPTPMVSASISHVPTIILAILEGPFAGALMGCIFGLCTLIKAFTMPAGVLDPLFMNPLVSVLPRILIGLTSYYSYRLLGAALGRITGKLELVSVGLGAAVGSLTNSIGCLGMIYFIYAPFVLEKTGDTAAALFWTVVSTFGLVEMAICVIITVPVAAALKRMYYR